jgi:hypothetical protein
MVRSTPNYDACGWLQSFGYLQPRNTRGKLQEQPKSPAFWYRTEHVLSNLTNQCLLRHLTANFTDLPPKNRISPSLQPPAVANL